MENTIDTITISNDPLEGVLDFQYLRQEGIKHIQRLAGKIWTDYNLHDPGITILDQLCYAITDLSYRINYDIKDLLAEENESTFKELFSPAEILTVNPVTLLDLRKVVLDVAGVKNAWVEKVTQPDPEIFYDPLTKSLNLANPEVNGERLYISGLYKVLVEKSESATVLAEEILPNVKKRLYECRGLCEDFSEIRILDQQYITISGNIEVGQVEDINTFAAKVLFKVANYISPQITFYNLEELLNKGKRIDEIFEGPALQHGFIDDDELARNDRKTELHTSDIIRELMDETEVVTVNNIALAIGNETAQNWRLILDKEKMPALDKQMSLTSLNFFKNDLKLTVDVDKVEDVFAQLRNANLYFPLEENKRDITVQPGKYRDIGKYYSIQNHFPQSFGIGEIGLPESATLRRTAQTNQLKAYLLFFEQILANYFAQVAHAENLFSFYKKEMISYYHQSLLLQVPGMEKIVQDSIAYEANLAACTENEAAAIERKNRFLNHLLARFGESLTDYSLWMYNQSISASGKATSGNQDSVPAISAKIVEDKLSFLRNYPQISNDRGKAFNYTLKSWETENISGLEKRVASKLGINNYKKISLAASKEKGFHMLEHILLRPLAEDFAGFIQYLVPKPINSFEAAGAGNTKCVSIAHGLQNGEQIEIRGSDGYHGEYNVEQVVTDSFQIKKTFVDAGKSQREPMLNSTWQRKQVNTNILLLTRSVTGFSAAATNDKTVIEAPNHGLEENESVEILGTINYNGIYKANDISANKFSIKKAFTANETTGRWINPLQRKDPYSLQLTFVFPDSIGDDLSKDEVQKNNYRAFIENTIREETPVHLTVYIRWLTPDELLKFEDAYHTFLEQLSNN